MDVMFKSLLKNNQIPKQQFNGLASNLMRCTYVLNEWEKGMSYLNDKVFLLFF